MKKKHDENNKSEGEVMKRHGKVYLIKSLVERSMLKCYKVFMTRHHGGDSEGNSVRNLMKSGDDVFEKTSAYLIEKRRRFYRWLKWSNKKWRNKKSKFLNYFVVI